MKRGEGECSVGIGIVKIKPHEGESVKKKIKPVFFARKGGGNSIGLIVEITQLISYVKLIYFFGSWPV